MKKSKGLFNQKLKNRQFKMSLSASFIILATVPLVVLSVIKQDSFDTSSNASFDQPPVTCTISFPYVNPLTLQSGGDVQLTLEANEYGGATTADYQNITDIEVTSQRNGTLFTRTYDTDQEIAQTSVSENFTYSTSTEGVDTITGVVKSVTVSGDVNSINCDVKTPLVGNKLAILAVNESPTFTTSGGEATLEKGDSYSYTIKATDPEGDPIKYHTSFTPGETWLKVSEIKNGSTGELELKFQGIAGEPGGYLANVFITDGYTSHIKSQSWVISVEQGENDTPNVNITEPIEPISVVQGEKVTLKWDSTDLNQIVKYDIYYADDVGDNSTWKKLDSLTNKFGGYVWDTSDVSPSKYSMIVEATDNQTPPLTGMDTSALITVGENPDNTTVTDPTNDTSKKDNIIDGPVISKPLVVDMSPEDGAELKNPKPTISATLTTGSGAKIVDSSIKFEIDNNDITQKVDIAKILNSEYRVIYKPDDNLDSGDHKVTITFTDDQKREASETWTFTITGDSNSDVFNLFGLEIPKKTATIIGIGLLVLLAALAIPWILYAAWKNSNEEDNDYTVYDMPPSNTDNSTYNATYNNDYPATSPETTYMPNATPAPISGSAMSTGFDNPNIGSTPNNNFSDTYINNDFTKAPESPNSTQADLNNTSATTDSFDTSIGTPPVIAQVSDENINRPTDQTPQGQVEATSNQEIAPAPEVVQPVQPVQPTFTDGATDNTVAKVSPEVNAQPVEAAQQVTDESDNVEDIEKLAQALDDYKKSDPYAFLDDDKNSSKNATASA